MPDERLLLVQDLIDCRLSADNARQLRTAIEGDPDLFEAHQFFLWLNAQLPALGGELVGDRGDGHSLLQHEHS